MDKEQRQRLIALAREDSDFFHALVFDPKAASSKLDFVDAEQLGRIDPGRLMDILVGGGLAATDCGHTNTCGWTCTHTNSLTDELQNLEG
ncbi:MAG: hypothetical protein AAF567_08985 [Actinomycetota bacterium]